MNILKNIGLIILCIIVTLDVTSQETESNNILFKVANSDNIKFRDPYNYKDYYFSDVFKVGNDECKRVSFKNKYGIYNMTQNKWLVNIQFNSIDYVRDSLFRLGFFFERISRLFHTDPNSIFNIDSENQIEINKEGLLLITFNNKSQIYDPRTNQNINLDYNSASLIGDSLILVRNLAGINGQSNLVDFSGNLLLNKWWKHISFRNGEYFATINGDVNGCNIESKIDFKLKDINNVFISDKGNIRFNKNFKNKYNAIINNSDTLPFDIDTFYINNENDLLVKTGDKFCMLCSSRLGHLRDFKLNNQINFFDSLTNDSYSVRIYNNKKAGLLTNYNLDLAKSIYENIFLFGSFKNERYVILNKNKISIYDYRNKLIKECPCDNPYSIASKKEKPTKELVVCFQKNGEVLTYDVNGNIVPKSQVWFTNESLEDLDIDNLTHNTIIRINDDYGLISKEKKILIQPRYDYVYKTYIDGVYLVSETTFKEKYVHLIDIKTGKKVSYSGFRMPARNSNLKYVELENRNFKSTYYEVCQNPLRLVSITFFDEMINPYSRTIILCKKDKYGMESLKGNTLINTKYDNCFQVSSGITACKDESKKYAIFDERGTILTEHKFDSIVSLNWHFLTTNKDTITLFNANFENGTKLTELKFFYGYNFIKKNSLVFIVEKNGKFGVFDMNGNEKLKAEYDQIMATKVYTSIFKRGNKFYFSPTSENDLFKNGVDTAFFFKNVQHQDDHGVIVFRLGKKYGLHRPNLQFTEAIFDEIYEIHGDYLLVEIDRKLGLYDIKRKVFILTPDYNGIFYKNKADIVIIKNNLMQTISINN